MQVSLFSCSLGLKPLVYSFISLVFVSIYLILISQVELVRFISIF